MSFFLIDLTELSTKPRLRTFTRDLPLVGRTSHHAIFDALGGRAVEAARRSEADS